MIDKNQRSKAGQWQGSGGEGKKLGKAGRLAFRCVASSLCRQAYKVDAHRLAATRTARTSMLDTHRRACEDECGRGPVGVRPKRVGGAPCPGIEPGSRPDCCCLNTVYRQAPTRGAEIDKATY